MCRIPFLEFVVKAIHLPRPHHSGETSYFTGLRRLIAALRRQSHRRKAFRHLSALDDHILRDIGVERSLVVLAANAGTERVCASPEEPHRM
jgi:uncharacterized protein YjiS (DUF1127 family)